MTDTAFFQVDTQLTALLGETYRSSETAIKELVDNAWDADADHVWVTLPEVVSKEPIVVRDDGLGMAPSVVRTEYLNIASDRRSRSGEKSVKYGRKIKGRKGIGKFAGLAMAEIMIVETRSEAKRTIVEIDKKKIREARKDLEQVPLPFLTSACGEHDHGTTVTLRALNQSLSVPTGDALRAILVYEYGREPNFQIFVNDQKVTEEDLPGQLHEAQLSVLGHGVITVRFKVIPEGSKSPKKPGLVLRAGKVVGTPGYFGLEQDENIPRWLLKRVYGEVVADQIEDEDITSDWGAVKANSKAFQAITAVVQENVRSVLSDAHKKDIARHKARLQSDIDRRLAKLPEHRRAYARKAIDRALERFYAERSDRIGVAAELVLDAMELDDYWLVFQALDEGGRGDVAKLAEALAEFGLFELSLIAQGAKKRLLFLDKMQILIDAHETVEATVHKVIEDNLWLLGQRYSVMLSNVTLKNAIEDYTNKKYSGARAKKRPDLLLAGDSGDRLLLVEFKRPSHPISRGDEAQAQNYRDELGPEFPGKVLEVVVVSGKRQAKADARYSVEHLSVRSYRELLSQARHDLEWVIRSLQLDASAPPQAR